MLAFLLTSGLLVKQWSSSKITVLVGNMAYMGSDNQSQSIRAPLARAPVSQGIHRTPPLSLPPAPGGTPYLIGGVSLHRSFFTCRPHTRPVPKEQRIIDSPLLDFFGTGKRS